MSNRIDWSMMLIEGYSNDHDMLVDLYTPDRRNLSLEEVGRILGVNKYTVRSRLIQLGIPIKSRGGNQKKK